MASIQVKELKNGAVDVSNIVELNKNGHLTKGFKKLSDLLNGKFLYLDSEAVVAYVNGRQTNEVSGYRVRVMSITLKDTIEVTVADELPLGLVDMEEVDFENCLMTESAGKSGSGDFERYPITRRFIATKLVRNKQPQVNK
ncbi:hypothetical protein [Faecalicoccus pleomorphus]|uniref:hypothetical protein n=1 Tax=Faecalicoccus pleomorphus TaxID=1323 RepID=UPI0026EF57BB|nr:hypothetical protein [Faecalicoccus pleomorphus]